MATFAAAAWILMALVHPCRADSVPGEYIATRTTFRGAWQALETPSRHLARLLDPEGRVALFRGTAPEGPGLRVQPNFRYRLFDAGNPDLDRCWGLENTGQTPPSGSPGVAGADIGAPAAWPLSEGDGVVVAVIDSGVDAAHEDLAGQLWRNAREIPMNGIDDDGNGLVDDVDGWNFVAGSADVRDDNGHGTLCAGLIAAKARNGRGARGVAPGARVMALKAVDGNGIITSARAIEATGYAARNGAAVVNASWGGTDVDLALRDAIADAGRRGVLFIAAAGNDGKDNDGAPKPTYPASFRLPTLISVAAYDNRDRLAGFSNYGKESVALGAPGVGIYGPSLGGYRFGDGTSFAAPFVAGAAALLKSFVPALGPEALRERLLATSAVVGYYEKERTATAGRVHAANALRDIRPPRPAPPAAWAVEAASFETEHPYAPRTSWRERLVHPGARHVRAHFKGFDTEACCDRVRLTDGDGREVAVYAGRRGDFWSADALGDTLVVELTSDSSLQGWGFVIDAIGTAE